MTTPITSNALLMRLAEDCRVGRACQAGGAVADGVRPLGQHLCETADRQIRSEFSYDARPDHTLGSA